MAKSRRSPRPRSRVHFLPRICEAERTSDPGANHNTLGAGCPGKSSSGRRQNKSGDDSFHRSSSWAGRTGPVPPESSNQVPATDVRQGRAV